MWVYRFRQNVFRNTAESAVELLLTGICLITGSKEKGAPLRASPSFDSSTSLSFSSQTSQPSKNEYALHVCVVFVCLTSPFAGTEGKLKAARVSQCLSNGRGGEPWC